MVDTYNKILVALDGSVEAEKAFDEAVTVALRNQATLILVSIINDVELSVSSYAYSKLFVDEKEKIEHEMVKKVQQATHAGVITVQSIVEVGNPKKYIAHTVPEEAGIDLIVIGATGKGALTRALVGSTTQYVVNHAPCNVLVVK
ncbi:MAG: universal stress protein [Enterococcus sp.]